MKFSFALLAFAGAALATTTQSAQDTTVSVFTPHELGTTTYTPLPVETEHTSACTGHYFNGACDCPCGAVCSCPAPTTTTYTPLPVETEHTSACTGHYFNGACDCPCGAVCSCAASTTTATPSTTGFFVSDNSPLGPESTTTSACTGHYFNGACDCPCGAVCSCAAPTTTSHALPARTPATTSACTGHYFNGACSCPCGAVCSCASESMMTIFN